MSYPDTRVKLTTASLQVKSAKSSRTKFGVVLVVETFPVPQKYMLGFQISPLERLEATRTQLEGLIAASRLSPNYGLQASEFIDPTHLSDQVHESSSLECGSLQPRRAALFLLTCATYMCILMEAKCSMCANNFQKRTAINCADQNLNRTTRLALPIKMVSPHTTLPTPTQMASPFSMSISDSLLSQCHPR
jgi:hypothetical protein